VEILYLGHAGFLVSDGQNGIAIDPFLRPRLGFIHNSGYSRELVTTLVNRRVDAVFYTHLHPDHADHTSLRYISPHKVYVPGDTGYRMRSDQEIINEGDSVSVGGLVISVRGASHPTSRLGRRSSAAHSYLIQSQGKSVYHSGDTDLDSHITPIENLDVALLPLGGWGPKLGPGHMDPVRAALAANILGPKTVVPMHYQTLHIMGLGSWWRHRSAMHLKLFEGLLDEGVATSQLQPGASLSV
jgi:L-ascorbate metabolism protein UlaG (beta-lactamase superfamily)